MAEKKNNNKKAQYEFKERNTTKNNEKWRKKIFKNHTGIPPPLQNLRI